ncbi:response regulator transcription factor [Planctomycetota bacterium]
MKVLVAEDDDNIRNGLLQILEDEGYQTLSAADGREAIALFGSENPDFICLDIMMPGMDGYEVCKQIRAQNQLVPIIFISAKSEEIDRVLGLEFGADDYIVKPFGVKEVIARIRAVTRRCLGQRQDQEENISFKLQNLEVFPAELRANRGDTVIDLSLREVKILDLFYRNKGVALDRSVIFTQCWGVSHIPNSRTLDQQISQLRKRIEADPKNPDIIQTVHGVGYRFDG